MLDIRCPDPSPRRGRFVLASATSLYCSLLACATHPGLHLGSAPPPQAEALVSSASEQLHGKGNPARAEALARQALKLDPHLGSAHGLLAEVAMLRADVDGVFQHRIAALGDGRDRHTAAHLDRIPLDYLGQSQLAELAGVLSDLAKAHPDPTSRVEALGYLVPVQLRRGDIAAARQALTRRTLLDQWYGIGGFDNEDGKGFDVPYPPEQEIDIKRSYEAERGRASWRLIRHNDPEPTLELDERFYPFRSNTAYLVTYVKSSRERELVLELASSAPIKAWVNDRSVLSTREIRHIRHRQLRVSVRLNKGYNKLLLKSCVDKGDWELAAWFARRDGTPVALQVSAAPRPYQRDTRPPRPWSVHAQGRDDLERALRLAAEGLHPSALDLLGRHLEASPRDPVGLLFAALVHEAEGQLQRASQLLEQGQRLPAPYNARFWIEAAALYRKRGQLDKAFTALERARGVSPQADLMVARSLDTLYARKGWTLDRQRLATRLHAARPDWVWPTSVLASCYRVLNRSADELRWLRQAVRLAPASERLRGRLVQVLLRRGQCVEAVAEERRTTRLRPDRANPFLGLARALRSCGKPDEALGALDRCVERIPAWPLPYELKGKIYYEQGRTEEAIAQWTISLTHNPDHVKLWDRLTHLRPDRDPILQELTPSPERIARAIARGVRIPPAEGSSVVWLLDHEVSRLMPDGTFKRVVTTVRRAVDRAGRDALGQARLPRSGLVKVLEAYTLDSRGRRREVTSMHNRTVRYPTLEEGAIVVLQYRHIKRPSGYLRHHLATSWYFQHNLEQALHAEWILALPTGRKLNLHLQGDISHRVTTRHGLKVHDFVSRAVPPLRPEPQSPPAVDLLRSVVVSTVPSWDYFSEWGNSLTAEVFAMDPELRATLKQLVRGRNTTREKIDAVYHFALTRIRYQQDYETFIAGVKPHAAAAVLSRGYGDCKDKSVLIIAMLRALGIQANLALVRTRGAGRVTAEVPSQQFNHAVVYVPSQPGVQRGRFLDATAENLDIDVLRPDTQGTLSLVLFPDGYKLIPVPYGAPESNWFDVKAELALEPTGLARARVELSAKGVMAGRMRKPLQNHQILTQYAQAMVHQLYPDCSLGAVTVDGNRTILKPLVLRIEASCPDAARLEEGMLRLRPPPLLAIATSVARWTERRHPLFLGPPDLSRAEVTLRLPPGVTVHSRPQPLHATDPCLEIDGRWTEQDGGLRYAQRIRRTCAEVEPSAYGHFRNKLNQLKRYLEGEVVIAPAGEKRERARRKKGGKKGS